MYLVGKKVLRVKGINTTGKAILLRNIKLVLPRKSLSNKQELMVRIMLLVRLRVNTKY